MGGLSFPWQQLLQKLSQQLMLMLLLTPGILMDYGIMAMDTSTTVLMDTMDTSERRRGKLSPLLTLMLMLQLTLGLPLMDMDTERKRGKLSPLLPLMLMLKLTPGIPIMGMDWGIMAMDLVTMVTIPMDTMDTDMEGSRTSHQDNLRNMILLETKPMLVLSS